MSLLDRVLAWLYDRNGDLRAEQVKRMERARRSQLLLREAEKRAITQIERTNSFVAEYQRGKQ